MTRKLFISFVVGAIVFFVLAAWVWHLMYGAEPLTTSTVEDSKTDQPTVLIEESDESEVQTGALVPIVSLSQLGDLTSHFERTASLRRALAEADVVALKMMLIETSEIESSSWKVDVQTELFRKLAELDPAEALTNLNQVSWNQRDTIISTVFAQWTESDLEGAIAHLDQLDSSVRQVAARSIVLHSDQESVEDLLQLARELGAPSAGFEAFTQWDGSEGISDPSHTWDILISDPIHSSAKVIALTSVAIEWMEQYGIEILPEIVKSVSHWPTRGYVVGALLARKAETDPQSAFNLAMDYREETHDGIFGGIAKVWATNDPVLALDSVSEKLSEPVLIHRLQSVIIETWSERDPQEVLDSLDQVPETVQILARDRATQSLAAVNPRGAAAIAGEWSQIPLQVGQVIVSNWAKLDPSEVQDWVLATVEDSSQQKHLLDLVWQELVQIEPEAAFQSAQNIAITGATPGLEADVIRSLARHDIEKAKSMLPLVRDGMTKAQAYSEVGVELVMRNKSSEAVQLGEQLQGSEKEGFLKNLVARWAYLNPNELASVLEEISSADAQSAGAMWLIMAHRRLNALSEEELEDVKSYLNKTDATRLNL